MSVVIPAFNPGAYLQAALSSVLEQTFGDWEAIVVDDGSTEDLSWVDTCDPRIRRLRQSNAGLSAARNVGISQTQGELIAFVDADDVWRPEKLARQVEVMLETDAALSSTAFEIIDGDGKRVRGGYERYAESYEGLLLFCGICVSTSMVRRRVLDEVGMFDTEFRQAQDWDLWLRIAKNHPVMKLPTVLADYRQHHANMSKNYRLYRQESRAILRQHECQARIQRRPDRIELARRGRSNVDRVAGAQAFDQFRGCWDEKRLGAVRYLVDAVRYSPRYTAESVIAKLFHRSARGNHRA